MNLSALKSTIVKHVRSIPGWRSDRKILVIESDDWGSIRMPSRSVYTALLNAGVRVDQCPYNRFDSLASEDDLTALFDTLSSVKDTHGNPAVVTANTIVANPDFEKIKQSDFQQYFYEPFTETLQKYPAHSRSFQLWKEGMAQKVFYPQLHGREHLNVARWMKGLQSGLKETRLAFDLGLFGISTTITTEKRKSYMAALDYDDDQQRQDTERIVGDGASMFRDILGYTSQSFIAPNYVWDVYHEQILKDAGIQYLQGSRVQLKPAGTVIPSKPHRLGEKNSSGQYYLVRNCTFEPSLSSSKAIVEKTFSEIETAFLWRKPAIICSHRLNFIGSIEPANRDKNLSLLQTLLQKVIKKYPDVEFMHSAQLGNLISGNKVDVQ